MGYWLLKSEPSTFGIADLEAAPDQTTPWEGVRNYQARNYLRDGLALGDQAFFYHSSTAQPAIVGLVEVVRAGYPDETAFDPASRYHDPASTPANPRWYRVDVRLIRRLRREVTLAELKRHAEGLGDFPLLRRGNRLSVLPVTAAQWALILDLEIDSERSANAFPHH
ncbi:MAG: EVE domain-containing protein [Candidatus Competibacteraceae bacterium]|nr:MAG: EVE domain-containing protein [Candidatus Competibacteraceae bacterium]